MIKPVKDMPEGLFIHAAAGVRYGYFSPVAAGVLPQDDGAAGFGELDGVGEKIVSNQLHQALVGLDGACVLQVGLQLQALVLPPLFEEQGAFRQLGA